MSLERLQQRIREAAERREPLRLRGGGTKDFYGGALRGEIVDTREHAGIVDYEPSELVLTARGGTPLAEIERLLEANGQMLPFEPPRFGDGGTLGGCVAAGLSGPRRAYAGAVRDFVLGAKLIDGQGRALAFGGRVMKNVAGYDVSRLLAGSLGTLGLLAEVSLKVLPRPTAEASRRFELSEARALEAMNRWAGEPLPMSGSAWHAGELRVRLSGAASAVRAATARLGGEALSGTEAASYWASIRDQSAGFFVGEAPLWRLSVSSASPPLGLGGEALIEWGGALRWLRAERQAEALRAAASAAGGHATLFRARERSGQAFTPPPGPAAMRIHRALKQAFDPAGILNPGRLYAEL